MKFPPLVKEDLKSFILSFTLLDAGSILQIEPKYFDSGYKPEPARSFVGAVPKGINCHPEVVSGSHITEMQNLSY